MSDLHNIFFPAPNLMSPQCKNVTSIGIDSSTVKTEVEKYLNNLFPNASASSPDSGDCTKKPTNNFLQIYSSTIV